MLSRETYELSRDPRLRDREYSVYLESKPLNLEPSKHVLICSFEIDPVTQEPTPVVNIEKYP